MTDPVDIEVELPTGEVIGFACERSYLSALVNREILLGKQYPSVPWATDVEIVLDVGANCGAASVLFAHVHPQAQIHAFEPGRVVRELLETNTDRYDNITVHPFGLHETDMEVPFYQGEGESVLSSVVKRDGTTDLGEVVTLRDAGAWAAEQGLERIDLLKVDVEGCELEVLRSFRDLLPTVKVLYIEYDHRTTRRAIDRLLEPTHELFFGKLTMLDQGECMYVRSDLADHPDRTDLFISLLVADAVGSSPPTGGDQG